MLKQFFAVCFLIIATVINAEFIDKNQILQEAEQQNLPIVAIFTTKQDCPWSQKLREEVLDNSRFRMKIGSEALLWEINLEGKEGEKELRETFHVQTCPVILLLDPQGKEFARVDYAPLNAEGYAAEIHHLIEHFQEICVAIDSEENAFEEERWQELYRKAKKFSAAFFKQAILERGMQQEKGTFFHVEKLSNVLEKRKLKHPQVRKLKKQILQLDPDNTYGTQFKVAVLEFHKILSRSKHKDRFDKPLAPLFQFLRKYGKADKENYWKAELMIAEYLFSKNFTKQALDHAEVSYSAAPDSAKSQIMATIAHMKGK